MGVKYDAENKVFRVKQDTEHFDQHLNDLDFKQKKSNCRLKIKYLIDPTVSSHISKMLHMICVKKTV